MPVLKQLLAEFWLPFIVALAWTCFNVWPIDTDHLSLRATVNIFGPTFFFASWLMAQWYRVRKQQKVEGNLSTIEASVKQTLSDLDTKTSDLVDYITGGQSACCLQPMRDGSVALNHLGKHPLYDVRARVADLEKLDQIEGRATIEQLARADTNYDFGNLFPGQATLRQGFFDLAGTYRGFNIFYTARNGHFVQLLRFRRVGDEWLYATKVERDGDILFEDIQDGYQIDSNGQIQW
jgi:hypothetical protein